MERPSSRTSSARLECIDFLRGCAAFVVVVYHTAIAFRVDQPWNKPLFSVLQEGRLAVPLFFVISGFCIHMRWARRRAVAGHAQVEFLPFWKRRLRRLYPPYFAALCLSMGLLVVAALWPAAQAFVVAAPEYSEPVWPGLFGDFVAHALMLHGLRQVWDFGGGNAVFWTLAREEYFYLLYFPLLFWRGRFGIWLSVLAVLILGVLVPRAANSAAHHLHYDPNWIHPFDYYHSTVALWIQWVLGMVAVEAFCGIIKLPRWCRWFWLFPAWLTVAWFNKVYGLWYITPIFHGIAFFTLINWCVAREQAGRWPQRGPARQFAAIGIFSYSLYLVHYPVIRALSGLERVLREYWQWQPTPLYYAGAFATIVAITCVAGWIFFILIERHFLSSPAIDQAAP